MRSIDVNAVIETARFRPFHRNILIWCTVIILFGGYDLVIYGVVLPRLMEQWQLSPVDAGLPGGGRGAHRCRARQCQGQADIRLACQSRASGTARAGKGRGPNEDPRAMPMRGGRGSD